MLDSGETQHHGETQHYNDDGGRESRLLFVPFMPGATALHARMACATSEERGAAVDELVGIGEVLYELMSFEEESAHGFRALPREYQDWIISLISQVLARLHRDSRPRQ